MKTIRLLLGHKQMLQLEKTRKILYHVATQEYEILLADNVSIKCVKGSDEPDEPEPTTDRSKMN